MSRGPSPSPLSKMTSLPSSTSTSEAPTTPIRPLKASLRVETMGLHPVNNNGSSSRNRSNSAQSHSPLPHIVPSHQFSRSLSHSTVASLGPTSPVGNNDVAMAVNGLRGMLMDKEGSSASPEDNKSYHHRQYSSQSTSEYIHGEGAISKQIKEALEQSNDDGNTLDLSRRGIQRIDDQAVEMFRKGVGQDSKGVWRLALSYNALHDGSIVNSFCRLSRLRYLNLKGNRFTEFPSALTEINSLEILDLSKNQIEAFPDVPGRLAKLKVLSLTRNKIYALPNYLTTFHSLKVFKVDQNPIEWPPREVLGALIDMNYSQVDPETGVQKRDEDMRPWIENMKSWMRQRAADGDRVLSRNKEDDAYLASEEEPVSAVSVDTSSVGMSRWAGGSQTSLVAPSSQQTIRAAPVRDETDRAGSPFSTRIKLGNRTRSATMSDESLNRPISPGLAPPIRPWARHDRSQSNSSFAEPLSASTASSSSNSRAPSANLPPPTTSAAGGHSRGASYTATQRLSGNLLVKKSLPDLRQSHAKIMQDRRNDGQPVEGSRPLGLGINAPMANRSNVSTPWTPSPKSPLSGTRDLPRQMIRKASAEMLRNFSNQLGDVSGKRDLGENGTMADESRNSYFRRLSTLPVSTLSKTIPPALLQFIDAIRGILFALTQIHSALRQYLIHAVQDRVASVFNRVMEPAGTYMANLINALDRFDSMSRRSTPPSPTIRGVIDSAKECIAVFSKIVAVLRLQLPALRGGDVRYTRTLLLMIYGSMAEIGCSWGAMEPLLVEIKPFLTRPLGGVSMMASNSLTGRTPISPIPERGESRSPSSAHRSSVSTINASPSQLVTSMATVHEGVDVPESAPNSATTAKAAKTRRQGGSFSMEDVERGMLMGSPGPPSEGSEEVVTYHRHRPSASAQIVLEDQTEESEDEDEEIMPLPVAPFAKTSRSGSIGVPTTPPELTQHPQLVAMAPTGSSLSRRGHQATSSAGSMSTGLAGPMRKLSVDIRPPTPASATLYDEDLLDVIETATDIAFTVWLKLSEDIHSSESLVDRTMHIKTPSHSSMASTVDSFRLGGEKPSTIPSRYHSELVVLLSRAEQITTTLRETLAGIRANPMTWSQSSLPEDAQAFIKTVVKVSELVKAISSTHTFSSSVRHSCSRLTQATRECAILIQVSSLRPGASTPAPIPMSARPLSPAYRNRSTAESSVEDLSVPNSAGHWNPPNSAASFSSLSGGSGLRGLQLPSRHAARRREVGKEPKSAQPGQVVFG